uniref:Diguanylate cyclase/phosphodiesterase with PAS/PAC sensor(S) n=2 Tax=Gloeothece TaxID=28070 RepID=E0U619_GLOV7|nr:diguanylate cyclase/phosphodiesterase with PAS/PAC sensor(s) [Gloeothece verrucosa PCC 7822]
MDNHENELIDQLLETIKQSKTFSRPQCADSSYQLMMSDLAKMAIPQISLALKEALETSSERQEFASNFEEILTIIDNFIIKTDAPEQPPPLNIIKDFLKICCKFYLKIINLSDLNEKNKPKLKRNTSCFFEALELEIYKQKWIQKIDPKIPIFSEKNFALFKEKQSLKNPKNIELNEAELLFDKNHKIISLNSPAAIILTGGKNQAEALIFLQKEMKRKLLWLKTQIEQFSRSNQEENKCKIFIKTQLEQQRFEAKFTRRAEGTAVTLTRLFDLPDSQTNVQQLEKRLKPEVTPKDNPHNPPSENRISIKEFAITSSISAIAIGDLQGNLTYVNQAFLEMWRYDNDDEVLGKPFLNFWQIDQQGETLIQTIRTRGQWIGELIAKKKDKSLFKAQVSANLVKNEANIAIYIMISVMDVSQQQGTEESLQKLLRLYTNLTQAAPVGIFRADESGKWLYANEKALLISGISLDKAIGMGWANYVHNDDRARVFNEWIKSIQTQTSWRTEYRYRHSDGNNTWVLVQAIPEMDEQGKIVGYLGTLTDITERKNAEEATNKINAQMQAIFDAFPDILFRIDQQGTILDYKTQDHHSLYCSPQEFIGRTVQEVLPESVGNLLYEGVQKALVSGEIVSIEYFLIIALQKRFFDARIVRLSPVETIAVVRDISDRKQTELALRESEERLKTIISTNPNGLLILDLQGKVLFVNPAAEILFGRKQEDLMGQILGIPIIVNNYSEIEILQPSGKLIIVRMRLVKIIWQEKNAFLASLVDVTDIQQAQEQLKILYQATEQSPVSVVITDAEGTIEYVNPKFEKITGYQRAEVIGQNPRILKSGETTTEEYKQIWKTITSGQEWHGEFHNKKKNGELFWEAASISPIKNAEGIITHFVAVKEDITERKAQQTTLTYQANYDALTGLPNRFLAIDRLKQAILQADRQKKRVAVMFIDLDHFKDVNDTLGHEYGDLLLQKVSQRLKQCLRKSDTVARLGGDEFLIILPNLRETHHCKLIASKILSSLEKPFNLLTEEAFISASIGITLYPDDGNDVSVLMRNADAAMYLGKRGGRNDFKFYTMGMNEEAQSRLRIEKLLRYALKKNEFYLVYQPIIDLRFQTVIGAEALLRWNNPELGRVSPDQFISIAEETGLISELGAWVISQACQEVVNWQTQGSPIWVAVNLSPRQFRESKLLEIISNAITLNGITNHYLELEITEKLLLEDFPGSKGIIEQLHEMDFRLSIDDFGTGYSALSYLIKFPFNRLKIDRSFIADIPHNQEVLALVKTIIAMGHGLKLQVIAEGVETTEQANILEAEGCDYAQGYFFSRPLLSEEFRRYLQSHQNPQAAINPIDDQ